MTRDNQRPTRLHPDLLTLWLEDATVLLERRDYCHGMESSVPRPHDCLVIRGPYVPVGVMVVDRWPVEGGA